MTESRARDGEGFATITQVETDPMLDPLGREIVNAVVVNGQVLEQMPISKQVEFLNAAHAEAVRPLVDLVESVAGLDCYHYDKILDPKPCGKCISCDARKALEQFRSRPPEGK